MSVQIEDKIEQHYKAEDGTWLVVKGKVTEAKMLKEAVRRIKSLKKDYIWACNRYSELDRELAEKRRELDRREKELDRRETRLKNTVDGMRSTLYTIEKEMNNALAKKEQTT